MKRLTPWIPIPKSVADAMEALDRLLADLKKAKTYSEIEKIIAAANAIKIIFKKVEDIRLHASKVVVLASHRIGLELVKQPKAVGTRGQKLLPGPGRGKKGKTGGNIKLPPVSESTLAELTGYKMKGHRLKKLTEIDDSADQIEITKVVDRMVEDRVESITVGSTLKLIAAEETARRRARSRAAPRLSDAKQMRIGDCREVLADVPDASVPLILTDPAYGDEAEPLYWWLAEFAARVLIPGGSLICYTGQSRLERDMVIFSTKLRYWWLLVMLHRQPQLFPGKFVGVGFKPVLWYVKEHRRGRGMVFDVLRDRGRDKEGHDWGQGEAGIAQLIEDLTEPGELIVDPFAGSGRWGDIAEDGGRRWLGADLQHGGTTTIVAHENEAAE